MSSTRRTMFRCYVFGVFGGARTALLQWRVKRRRTSGEAALSHHALARRMIQRVLAQRPADQPVSLDWVGEVQRYVVQRVV